MARTFYKSKIILETVFVIIFVNKIRNKINSKYNYKGSNMVKGTSYLLERKVTNFKQT